MQDLSGRVGLVTGASSGLGEEFARTMSRAGAKVVLGARRLDRVETIAAELETEGHIALAVALDVTDEASVSAAFDEAEDHFGTVDTVVCNAGAGVGGRSTDIPVAGLKQVQDTNLLGAFLTAREGARRMIAADLRESERGRIVLIGSITAQQFHT
ncbi:MAG: SDR family NAD(P)-dependent oxidoreductase, partial [Novosphingobium sp.]|nr:SDR family NAD(P)-dependent oxidoreductase [Novosphingobium sp.]